MQNCLGHVISNVQENVIINSGDTSPIEYIYDFSSTNFTFDSTDLTFDITI